MNTISKILLYPFALAYSAITQLRNYAFDKKHVRSVKFDFPIISVGNLRVGGTGKTPHIEYLLALLQLMNLRPATLSRGYARKTYGFYLATNESTALELGDEPMQFKKKFPYASIAVCEDRVLGVPRILHERPETDVILLDDAFQHRQIRPGLNILLTEFDNLFTRDEVVPLGWLREHKSNYHRADIIIVTKCPHNITEQQKQAIKEEIKPYAYQHIYFSHVLYLPLYGMVTGQPLLLDKDTDVLMVTAIANATGLENYLQGKVHKLYLREYRDHHFFDRYDVEGIRDGFNNMDSPKKAIITTEKDATRLELFKDWFKQNNIEIFVQPIEVRFNKADAHAFADDIWKYVSVTSGRFTPEENNIEQQ